MMPVVCLEATRDKKARIASSMAGTLNARTESISMPVVCLRANGDKTVRYTTSMAGTKNTCKKQYHTLSVSLGIPRSIREQDRMLLGPDQPNCDARRVSRSKRRQMSLDRHENGRHVKPHEREDRIHSILTGRYDTKKSIMRTRPRPGAPVRLVLFFFPLHPPLLHLILGHKPKDGEPLDLGECGPSLRIDSDCFGPLLRDLLQQPALRPTSRRLPSSCARLFLEREEEERRLAEEKVKAEEEVKRQEVQEEARLLKLQAVRDALTAIGLGTLSPQQKKRLNAILDEREAIMDRRERRKVAAASSSHPGIGKRRKRKKRRQRRRGRPRARCSP